MEVRVCKHCTAKFGVQHPKWRQLYCGSRCYRQAFNVRRRK